MKTLYTSIKAVFLFGGLLSFASCSNGTQQNSEQGKIAIEIDEITPEHIDLDKTTTTYEIESGIKDESIYVVDNYICTLNFFDTEGGLKSSHLGEGHASNETTIGRIAGHTFLPNGDLALFNTSAIFMRHDNDLIFKDWFRIDYNVRGDDADYDSPLSYTQRYTKIVCRGYNNSMYHNVELFWPETNMMLSGKEYLEKTSNIMEIDLEKQSLGRLFAKGFPESYSENTPTKVLRSTAYFDIDKNGNFYVTYEADSSIYVYNQANEEIARFGFAGRDMNLDYVAVSTLDDYRKNYRSENQKRGYYYWLEYDDVTGLVFRSYQKGEHESTDGLQIYRGHDLIADLDVPKRFRVMGYIKPYYYSYVFADEDAEKLYLYRFTL